VRDEARMDAETWLQIASLSKTVGTAFALETFRERGISTAQSANALLARLGSRWALRGADAQHSAYADAVTVAQLVNHTALGMHYVPGVHVPESAMPSAVDMLSGAAVEHGYAALLVERAPGVHFKYSGGGFIVLQHVLELVYGTPVDEALLPFLAKCGAADLGFSFEAYGGVANVADGYYDDGRAVPGRGGLAFPPLAAGGRGTPTAVAKFLFELAEAYHGRGQAISEATAHAMLDRENLVDLGSLDFMRARAGLGVFVARAGPNSVMLHQAANDGFRGVYVVCFDGPDAANGPVGFVVLANGDNAATFLNCDVCVALLRELRLEGVDLALLASDVQKAELLAAPQEQIVNLGYKELVFRAFVAGEEEKAFENDTLVGSLCSCVWPTAYL